MCKYIIFLFFTFSLFSTQTCYVMNAVVHDRFGDCLLSYLHAKWVSYYYDIPYLYSPNRFPSAAQYISQLVLSDKETWYQKQKHPIIHTKLIHDNIQIKPLPKTCYLCPYFPAFVQDEIADGLPGFPVDWKDKNFLSLVRPLVQPKHPLSLVTPPEDVVSIALHVREGSGPDTANVSSFYPLKLPHISFYQAALLEAISLFPGKPIYCFIFTDSATPEKVAEKMHEVIKDNPYVMIDYRQEANRGATNVLEDFFSLFLFDVLIRPRSNFSTIPSLLHDYAAVFFPLEGTPTLVSVIGKEINDALYQQLMQTKR